MNGQIKNQRVLGLLVVLGLVAGVTASCGDSPGEVEEMIPEDLMLSVAVKESYALYGGGALVHPYGPPPPPEEFVWLQVGESLTDSTAESSISAGLITGFGGFALGETVAVTYELSWDGGEVDMPFQFTPMAVGSLYRIEGAQSQLMANRPSRTIQKVSLNGSRYRVEFRIPTVEGEPSPPPTYYLFFGVGATLDSCLKAATRSFLVGNITYERNGLQGTLEGNMRFDGRCVP